MSALAGNRPGTISIALWLSAAIWAGSGEAAAQGAAEPGNRVDPVGPPAGGPAAPAPPEEGEGVSLRPSLRGLELRLLTSLGYDDNVRRTEVDRRGTPFLQARPAAYLKGVVGKHDVRLGYEGNYGLFVDLRDEDFDDHKLLAEVGLDLHRKLDVNLKSSLEYGHDPRAGSDVRVGQSRTPDEWTRKQVSGEFLVGRRIAKAQIGLFTQYSALRFTNNSQGARDRDTVDLRLTGYWNIGPKLSLVLEPALSYVDFVRPGATSDSREFDLLAGIRWEATFKTTGEFKVGFKRKNFDAPGEPDFSGLAWRGQILWERKTFSTLTLITERDTQESTDAGSNLVNSHLELVWRHEFTRRTDLQTGVTFDRAEFSDGRTDDLVGFRADLNYDLLRWLDVGGSYRFSYRDSNEAGLDFTGNVVFLNLVAVFARDRSR